MKEFDKERYERAKKLWRSKPVGNMNDMLNGNNEVRSFDKSSWKELREINKKLGTIIQLIKKDG